MEDTNETISRQLDYIARLEAESPEGRLGVWPTLFHTPRTVGSPKLDSHLLGLTARPHARGKALDAFTGSGAVAAWYADQVESVSIWDINSHALKFAAEKLKKICKIVQPLQDEQLVRSFGEYHTITANPPYTSRSATTNSERVCFDPNHTGTKSFIYILPELLASDGKAFLSWVSYADFDLLETWINQAGELEWEIASTIREPAAEPSGNMTEFRVYQVSR